MKTFLTSSGVELQIKPVPAMALAAMQSKLKKPLPPIEETTLGPKENEGHPDYIAAMQKYNADLMDATMAALIGLGVEKVTIDQEAVREIRDVMENPPISAKLNPNDKVIYVTMVLMTAEEEIGRLIQAIQELSIPSPALMEAQVDNFRVELPREGLILDQAARVGAIG